MANMTDVVQQHELFNQISEATFMTIVDVFTNRFIRGDKHTDIEVTRFKLCTLAYCKHIRDYGTEPRMYADVYEPVATRSGLYAEVIRSPVAKCIKKSWHSVFHNFYESAFWTPTFVPTNNLHTPPVNKVFMRRAAASVATFISVSYLK